MNAVLPWWRGLSARERLMLTILGALLALAILVLLIVKPMLAARAEAIGDIRTYAALNARLRSAVPGAPAAGAAQLSGPPATVVQTAAGQAGVPIVRSQAEGTRTRAIVDEASFPAVVQWLALLDTQAGVRIAETRIARRPTPGMVSVTLLFDN